MTGVTIVTTLDGDGKPCGFTANSFTSVSLEPPLVLVNIARAAHGCAVFTAARGFAVNILAGNQRELSNLFARAGEDKFAGVDWRPGPAGSPVIDGVVAWFDCRLFQQVDAGDHVILIGEVEHYQYNTHSPLGFCRGTYVSSGLSPRMLQLVTSPGVLRVGAIIEFDGRILLEREPRSGRLALPTAPLVGSAARGDGLLGKLAAAGIDIDLPFIYAAWEEAGVRHVYYVGELRSAEEASVAGALQFYEFDLITREELNDAAVTSMLERYIREKKYGNFSFYIGDPRQGETHPL